MCEVGLGFVTDSDFNGIRYTFKGGICQNVFAAYISEMGDYS